MDGSPTIVGGKHGKNRDKTRRVRVPAVQNLENLQTFILQQPCCRHGNAYQPIFPLNIIETSPTSLAHRSVFNGPNDFKFGTETGRMVLYAISKFRAD